MSSLSPLAVYQSALRVPHNLSIDGPAISPASGDSSLTPAFQSPLLAYQAALRAPLTPSIDGAASDFPLSVHPPTRVPSSICGTSQSLATRARALTPDDVEPFDDLLPVTDGESQSRFLASGVSSIAAFQQFLLQSLQSPMISVPPLHSNPPVGVHLLRKPVISAATPLAIFPADVPSLNTVVTPVPAPGMLLILPSDSTAVAAAKVPEMKSAAFSTVTVDYSPVFWPIFSAVVPSFSSHIFLGIVKPAALPVFTTAAAAVLSATMVFSTHFQVPGVLPHVCVFVHGIASLIIWLLMETMPRLMHLQLQLNL